MQGLMMDYPLTTRPMLERARRMFGHKEVATKAGDAMERTTFADIVTRAGRLATALEALGVKRHDRVATFAWNNARHLEIYLAVPTMGAVLHPLNLRLPGDQLVYIPNHAEDTVVFVDPSLLPAVEKLAPAWKTVKHYIVMGESVPETSLSPVHAYEDLVGGADREYDWPDLDEQSAAAMCYTSGTTGNPKGVVYTHRSIFLHTLGVSLPDAVGLCERDVLMPVVPMFHVLGWGTPFAAAMLGCKTVFTGPHLAPRDLASLIQDERVTVPCGVPTLWLGMLQLLEEERFDLSSVRVMPVGGAAAPKSMIEAYQTRHGIEILHAWGMTETSPVGTISRTRSEDLDQPDDLQFAKRARQGSPVPCVEIRAVDANGDELPWDGESIGELEVRGPWVASTYYNDERSSESFRDGWFRTGDCVNIDPRGCIQIVDRIKDVVKSGGEWISTQDIENALMAHPSVKEAAVIAAAHPTWSERPLACIVPTAPGAVTKEELDEFLVSRLEKIYRPDDIVFMEEIPKTSVGKFDKKVLRQQFAEYQFPS